MRSLLLLLAVAGLLLALWGPGQGALAYGQWWLFNTEPPSIAISGPPSLVRGQARFSVQLRPSERATTVAVSVDGAPLALADELVVDTASLPDGPHRLAVEVRDRSRQRNVSQQSFTFASDNTPPRLDVRLEPAAPTEGRTLVVRARLSEAGAPSGRLGGRELLFQGKEQDWWAVIGIPPEPAYRQLDLQLEAADALGNRSIWQQRYPLARTRFPLESLQVSPELERLLSSEVRAVEQARLLPIYESGAGAARWRGRFTLPVEGPLTTEFATRRSYNGRFPNDYHGGADLAAPLGTPVRAPGDARVAFAGQLEVRGNTVVLDHGAGVFSTYAHLEAILVKEGAPVRKGDTIARVGSTGLSTGPHLHWELWVGGANVDPLEWTEREIP